MSSLHQSDTPIYFEGWAVTGLMVALGLLGVLPGSVGVDFAPVAVQVLAASSAFLCILAGCATLRMLFTHAARRRSDPELRATDLYDMSSLFRFLLSSPPLGMVPAIFALVGKSPFTALGLPDPELLVGGTVVAWIVAVVAFGVGMLFLAWMLLRTVKVAQGYGNADDIALPGSFVHFLFAATIILVVVLNF